MELVGDRLTRLPLAHVPIAGTKCPCGVLVFVGSMKGCVVVLRSLCLMAVCLALPSATTAGEQSGLAHRASCTVVRYYVAKYTASAAETWARSKGATEAEIVAARRCLKDAPARPVQAAEWAAQ
jgi:hypothetical protein